MVLQVFQGCGRPPVKARRQRRDADSSFSEYADGGWQKSESTYTDLPRAGASAAKPAQCAADTAVCNDTY